MRLIRSSVPEPLVYRAGRWVEEGAVIDEDVARAAWAEGSAFSVERRGHWLIQVTGLGRGRTVSATLTSGWLLAWADTSEGLRFESAERRDQTGSTTLRYRPPNRVSRQHLLPAGTGPLPVWSSEKVHTHVEPGRLLRLAEFGDWDWIAEPLSALTSPWEAPDRVTWTSDLWALPAIEQAGLSLVAQRTAELLPAVDPGEGMRFKGAYIKAKDFRAIVAEHAELRRDNEQRRWIAEQVTGNRVVRLSALHDPIRGVGLVLGCRAGHSGWNADIAAWHQVATRPTMSGTSWLPITDPEMAHPIIEMAVRLWRDTAKGIGQVAAPDCVRADEPPDLYRWGPVT